MQGAYLFQINNFTLLKYNDMSRSFKYLALCTVALLFVFTACTTPKILFSVAGGKQLSEESDLVMVSRDEKTLPGKNDLKLKEGDQITIAEGVDGTGIRTFYTVSTVHGPATLVLSKDFLEQKDGTVLHDALRGKLLIPEMSIAHEGAAYLVAIQEKTIELIVFDGRILVSSTQANPPWKPFFVESHQRRKIWRDGRLAPNQPLGPDDLNHWIDSENQLLKAGNSTTRMVPGVITLPSVDAEALIASAGFPVSLQYLEEGEGELGTITKQEPRAGRRVKSGQQVVIYERSRPVIVPDVLGLSLGAAINKLQDLGLEGHEAGRTITRRVDSHLVNTQIPAAGEMTAAGSSVALSIEAVSVMVPNIIGMSISSASQALGVLKLEVDSTYYVLNFEGEPKVISQAPLENSYVIPGSAVKVWRQALGFEVPNVVRQTLLEATEKLTNEGFAIGETKLKSSDSVAKNLIISQEPAAGAISGKDVPVKLIISKGK